MLAAAAVGVGGGGAAVLDALVEGVGGVVAALRPNPLDREEINR